MRSPFFRPSASSALATRLVLTLNSANVVSRPSNSKASALPRCFACARTTSAMLLTAAVADMSLPFVFLFGSASRLSGAALTLVDPPIDRHHGGRIAIGDVLADGGHVPEFAERDLGDDLGVQHLCRLGQSF